MNLAIKAGAVVAVLVALAPQSVAAASPSLLGTVEFRAESLAALPKWQRTLGRIEAEQATYDACAATGDACPSPGALAWQGLIRSQAGRASFDQLQAINRFLNDWQYKTDAINYGARDYWASPLEFLRNSGDCEDYAIAKYVTLRQLGYPAEQLRLVVVHDTVRDLAHAVLAVYLNDQVYILDNLSRAVVPQQRLAHYVPYYSINETTRWAHVPPADRTWAASSSDRLSAAAGR